MFLSKHRLNIAPLRIGKHCIVKKIASLRNIARIANAVIVVIEVIVVIIVILLCSALLCSALLSKISQKSLKSHSNVSQKSLKILYNEVPSSFGTV